MTPEFSIELIKSMIFQAVMLASPILVTATTIGLAVSLFQAVTSIHEQTLSFDSASQSMEERKRAVILTVLAGSYDRNKDYYLTARDIQSKIEVLRLPVRIDLSFSNDF